MDSRNHQLYRLATCTTTTLMLANIIGVLCAKLCSKALYVFIHFIPPPNNAKFASPLFQKGKRRHRKVKVICPQGLTAI